VTHRDLSLASGRGSRGMVISRPQRVGLSVVSAQHLTVIHMNECHAEDSGRFCSSGEGGSMSSSARRARAAATHVPVTMSMRRRSVGSEVEVSRAIPGSVHIGQLKPYDVMVPGKHGIEVKTLHVQKNDKLTFHPDAKLRKEQLAVRLSIPEEGRHTIAIDRREGRYDVYYRNGLGSFRLKNMTYVGSGPEALYKLADAADWR
jgi:hypothetical protein